MAPGDILLIRTHHLASRLIRFGQRGYGRDLAQWNHVGVCVGNGEIVEALTGGIVLSPVSKYPAEDVRLVQVDAKPAGATVTADLDMRLNAVMFAHSCVGERYGWGTILCIALKALTRGHVQFGVQGTQICSGLAARSLERLGFNFNPYDPAELTPAFLAKTLLAQ